MSPLVVIPQIAKLPASNQNAGTRAPTSSPENAAAKLLPGGRGTGPVSTPGAWPYRPRPLSCGQFRMNSRTGGITATRGRRDQQRRPPPAVMGRHRRHNGQEDQLASGAGRGQYAGDDAAVRLEPAGGDRRDEAHRNRSGAGADEHTPQQHQLPARRHRDAQCAARRDHAERRRQHRADAEAIHQRRGERSGQRRTASCSPTSQARRCRATNRTRDAAGSSSRREPSGSRRPRGSRRS